MRDTGAHDKVRCGGCEEILLGEAIKVAANLHYHIQCFLCSTCGCELVNSGFFTKLAKYYCAEDYHSLFGTLCSLCGKYIEGEGLSVQGKGKSYHLSCLTCSKCDRSFDEGSRITFEKDEALCDECRKKRSPSTKHVCAGCADTIIGTSIYAMEQEWHMDCFTCGECKKSLSGEYMYKDGVPYCEQDYQTLYGQCCNICSEFIVGKVLQAGGNSYHTSCLKCYICTQPFEEGQEIFMQEEIFWHTDCDDGTADITQDTVNDVDKTLQVDTTITEPAATESVKKPPELILPPPPNTTPPPSTPKQEHAPTLDTLDVNISKSTASIASDYEDLVIPPEPGKSVVTESDFDEKTVSKSGSTSTHKSSSVKSHKSSKSVGESPKNASLSSNSEVHNEIAELNSENGDARPTNDVFNDMSEPAAIPETNGKQSDTSSYISDKENQHNDIFKSEEEPAMEEKQLSVKEILRLAQEKERSVLGNAVLPSKTLRQDFSSTKKYLSTDSEGSDQERSRSSESSAPSKPPRKSQARDPTLLNESPNSTVRGLRQVDSPILKLLNDLDNKDKDEQIEYLPLQATYDINVLQKDKLRLPREIDRSQLQQYLDSAQFQAAFRMDIDKFNSLPLWKKTNLKKAAALF